MSQTEKKKQIRKRGRWAMWITIFSCFILLAVVVIAYLMATRG